MTNVPASLVTVEFAERMYEQANASFRQARKDLIRYALLASVLLIRRHYPTATHLVVQPSDQSPYLTPVVIVDPECDFDDNEIEEYDDIVDNLGMWIGDIDDEDPWGHWQPFVTPNTDQPNPLNFRRYFADPTGRGGHWAFDLDLILFYEGDAEKRLADMNAEANA